MDRREMLGALGAGAIGLTTLSAAHADDAGTDQCCTLDKTHEDCFKACSECAKTCDLTFNHCYTKVAEGKTDHAKPLRMVSDCAGFCALSACMIAKHSPLMVHSCNACASACQATATEVEKFDSEEMKYAAKKLRECERSCRAMVTAMGGAGHHAN
jgi:hypothetical protein